VNFQVPFDRTFTNPSTPLTRQLAGQSAGKPIDEWYGVDPRSRAWVEIDLGAITANIEQIRQQLTPTTEIMAIVKADAYGHGAEQVAKTAIAAGAAWLGVATLEEGLALRAAGIDAPILVLGMVSQPEQVVQAWQANLDLTVCFTEQAIALSQALTRSDLTLLNPVTANLADPNLVNRNLADLKRDESEPTRDRHQIDSAIASPVGDVSNSNDFGESTPFAQNSLDRLEPPDPPLNVHINVDTGMSRLGIDRSQALELILLTQQLPGLRLASVYSHLATADEPDHPATQIQAERFQALVTALHAQGVAVPVHLSNSAGTIAESQLHYDRVRIGLALYGIAPAPHLADYLYLRPAMSVRARVTQVRTIPPGQGVSYGYRFVASRETRLATVAIGYADGVPRLLSGRLQVSIRGQLVPQVGNITMDQLLIDITDLDRQNPVQVGDVVTLIGQDGEQMLTASDWASTIGSIPWEIVCGFRQRLPRLYQ